MQNPWWTRRVHIESIFLLIYVIGMSMVGLAIGATLNGHYLQGVGVFVLALFAVVESLSRAWTDCSSDQGLDSPVPIWLRPWWIRNICDDFPYPHEKM